MRKGNKRKGNELYTLTSALICRELEAVSDYLYFFAVCEADYPEICEMFDRFGREHAENMKRLEKDLIRLGREYLGDVKAKIVNAPDKNICSVIRYCEKKEKEDRLLYERLYLIDEADLFKYSLKEILRASKERLSILENIQKT